MNVQLKRKTTKKSTTTTARAATFNSMPLPTKESNKANNNYTPIEECIYKTGNRYRVRVSNNSGYCETLKKARILKKSFRELLLKKKNRS